MFMFRSIAKRRQDDKKKENIIPFDDKAYVDELNEFVKTTFSELPETSINDEINEKKD